MAQARFDNQLRRVFTFITGLTVLVGVFAIGSNRYLVETHRALIQNNLPAAALTRQIQADASYVATLATSFADVGTVADLAALTGNLLTRVGALRDAVDDLAELAARAPELEGPAPPSFAALEAAVRGQADRALTRLQARGAVTEGLAASARRLAELEDIVARQSDTARVQVTATIADLYDTPEAEIAAQLDQLADENFFTYDRLYELSRAVEAARAGLEQVDKIADLPALTSSRAALQTEIDTARSRLAYLPSASARDEAGALIGAVAVALDTGGVYQAQASALTAEADLRLALERLRALSGGLVSYANALFEQMQAGAAASLAHTEALSRWITLGLAVLLAGALAAAGLAWAAVSRRTVARLAAVSQHITALARGDYGRAIPETGNDEIGRMEQALHVLRLRAAEAQRLRGELEEAVTQRTREVVTEMHAHDRARAEAEAANRAKSEFLAMMGHEIRTPLGGVVGMLRLIEEAAASPAERERATIARQSGENLLTLSNDILDYAATQERQPTLAPIHFDLRELMGQLGGYLRANAAEKGLKAVIDMAPGAPPALFGDLQKIRQVLVNLLSNAVKYTEAGEVRLTLDHAVEPGTGGHVLSFAVTDTGIGIAPADHARIFDAYSRGPAQAAGIEGLGLGLSICRRLTEALGGAITLESAPGAGSRFTFTLALPEGDIARVARQGEALTVAALGRRVLVVEDQVVNRMVARGTLERMGCEVVEAATGAEGVAEASAGGFDLILMDLDLPDMTGGAAAEQIRAALATPPPIVVLTADHLADPPHQRAELGADRILSKPISPRVLAGLLGTPAGPDRQAVAPPGTRAALASDLEDIGAEETAAIVAAFLEAVGPALAAMQAALATADMPALARQAHRLRGAASNFALTALCDQLGRIEAAAKAEHGVHEAVAGLEAGAAAAVAALTAAARGLGLQLSPGSASM